MMVTETQYPGAVARSDACLPDMRTVEIRSSGPAAFFQEDWSWIHFYGDSLSTADSSRAVVSYWQKVLVNHLESLPRNSVVRLTDHLDMTVVVDWDIKPQFKQTQC